MHLTNPGNSYDLRFGHLGELAALDNAISNKQKAVDLTPNGHQDRLVYLSNLGVSQHSRFYLLGDASDLEESIVNFAHAVEETDNEHPDKSDPFL